MQFTCNITVFVWKVDFYEFKMKHFDIELTLKNIECKYYVSHWSRIIDTSILLKYFFLFVIGIKIHFQVQTLSDATNAQRCPVSLFSFKKIIYI